MIAHASLLLMSLALADLPIDAQEPRVVLEAGKDFPETRWFTACPVQLAKDHPKMLAVAGFSDDGKGDVSDLAVYELRGGAAVLHWRLMQRGDRQSSIRTLRAADLNGDGLDELVALGRTGDERADSSGELRVFSCGEDGLQTADQVRWQSGKYTHGFGMDIGDLDGDGKAEIVTGGFFSDGQRESGELRVWSFVSSKLKLVACESWASAAGNTRINSVCVGALTGGGPMSIVTAGRTGQVHSPEGTPAAESDQLTLWSFSGDRLRRDSTYEAASETRSRFREVKLADIDGRPGMELLAVGRADPPPHLTAGGGNGTGRGNGAGGGRARGRTRPILHTFRVTDAKIQLVTQTKLDDTVGEVRDLVLLGPPGNLRLAMIVADDLGPQRRARFQVWTIGGEDVRKQVDRLVALGDQTQARQFVVWSSDQEPRLLTVGFVTKGDQILGQLLDWGKTP